MKETILRVLLENTGIKYLYTGGGEEPAVIIFPDSENCDKENYLSAIADEIVNAIKNK